MIFGLGATPVTTNSRTKAATPAPTTTVRTQTPNPNPTPTPTQPTQSEMVATGVRYVPAVTTYQPASGGPPISITSLALPPTASAVVVPQAQDYSISSIPPGPPPFPGAKWGTDGHGSGYMWHDADWVDFATMQAITQGYAAYAQANPNAKTPPGGSNPANQALVALSMANPQVVSSPAVQTSTPVTPAASMGVPVSNPTQSNGSTNVGSSGNGQTAGQVSNGGAGDMSVVPQYCDPSICGTSAMTYVPASSIDATTGTASNGVLSSIESLLTYPIGGVLPTWVVLAGGGVWLAMRHGSGKGKGRGRA